MNLPTLPYDKLGHFFYGSAASIVGILIAYYFGFPLWIGSLGASFAVGLVKDVVLDLIMKKGQFDVLDIVATAAGGIPGALASVIMGVNV